MSFMVSPGINISEVDLTAGARTVAVSDAAIAGPFQWGPALEVVNIGSEDELVRTFGKPDTDTFTYWFSAQAFLAYSNLLHVVRGIANSALNATASPKSIAGTANLVAANTTILGPTAALVAGQTLVLNAVSYVVSTITNATAFVVTSAPAANQTAVAITAYGTKITNSINYDAIGSSLTGFGAWVAKYPGDLGNSLKVSVCPSANAFTANVATGSITLTLGSATVNGASTAFTTDLIAGDYINVNGTKVQVASVQSANSLTLTSASPVTAAAAAGAWSRTWEFASIFDSAPSTSPYASARGGSKDEAHIVVVDEDGVFSGTPGTVLERYAFVSKNSDGKTVNGETNYYASVINRQSKYVWWLAAPTTNTTSWGSVAGSAVGADVIPTTTSLVGGQTKNSTISDGEIEAAYDLFKSPDAIDVSMIICGPANATVASYIIQNICEPRQDCVAFVSPTSNCVVNQVGSEVTLLTAFRNSLPSTSYGFLDSGWKYTYDKYNDVFRWVPLNGDIAGLAARADTSADPWYSPAGFSRGVIKNVVKLAWNPKQADRDDLYKIGINPVVSFPSQGVVLYGDKTLLSRPSAFDRINVRRLFIILEKTIGRLARTQLFEFNDEFTRSQFRNIVEPFLRDVKARRGVTDYRVICDDSNNTDEVVEQNRFVGDIYVKPSRSINFIQLNFVAVRNGVSFQEIAGTQGA